MLPDPEIIVTAVAFLSKYLKKISDGAAEQLGAKAADRGAELLAWMRSKLHGRAKEALADLEKAPDNKDNQADLRKQLNISLENNPSLFDELQKIISTVKPDEGAMTMRFRGDHNKNSQIRGKKNKSIIF